MEEKPRISRADFISCNTLRVELSDTGYRGGDAGHGGRVAIKLTDQASTCLLVNGEEAYTVRIELRGDSERDTLIAALEFVLRELKANGHSGRVRYVAENYGELGDSLIKGIQDDSFSFLQVKEIAQDAPHVLARARAKLLEKIKIDPRDFI